MIIANRTQGFELSSAIDTFVRDEINKSLGRFSHDIISVEVFMTDSNGPRGGVDKQVLMRIRMRGRQQVALQSTAENLYAAIRVSSKRAKRAVRRSLRKSQHFEKLSVRRLAAEPMSLEVPNA